MQVKSDHGTVITERGRLELKGRREPSIVAAGSNNNRRRHLNSDVFVTGAHRY